MIPFCNNLQLGDPVRDVVRARNGKVSSQPRTHSVNVMVTLEGNTAPTHIPLSQLRLIVEGTPEDVPPCDGEIPEEAHDPIFPESSTNPITVLKAERAKNQREMDGMNARFRELREENDRLDQAIVLLEGPKK